MLLVFAVASAAHLSSLQPSRLGDPASLELLLCPVRREFDRDAGLRGLGEAAPEAGWGGDVMAARIRAGPVT